MSRLSSCLIRTSDLGDAIPRDHLTRMLCRWECPETTSLSFTVLSRTALITEHCMHRVLCAIRRDTTVIVNRPVASPHLGSSCECPSGSTSSATTGLRGVTALTVMTLRVSALMVSSALAPALRRTVLAGMMTSTLTVQACQDLVDIGWTRAGYYMYKPDLSCMCCPSYTIRLNVNDFIPSKDQKRALRKLQKYLDGGALLPDSASSPMSTPRGADPTKTEEYRVLRSVLQHIIVAWCNKERLDMGDLNVSIHPPTKKQRKHLLQNVILTSPFLIAFFHKLHSVEGSEVRVRWLNEMAERFGVFFGQVKLAPYGRPCTKKQQSQWEMLMQGVTMHSAGGHLNFCLEEGGSWDEETASALLSRLSIRQELPSRPKSVQMESSVETSSPKCIASELPVEFCVAVGRKRSFTTHWKAAAFVQEEFNLYRKYQMRIHGESPERCTRSRYERFLVDSPLMHEGPSAVVPEPGMGSFHVQYRIDGRLVAVGVVDILPRSLCSAYFFWDPDFAPLSLGKISALTEIEWVKAACRTCPALQYYFIGYYVHSCAKTQYKGDYRPSQLLCPETCLWVKLTDDVRRRLREQAYLVLSEIPGAECEENVVLVDAKGAEKSSIEAQRLLLFDECLTLGECRARLNANGIDERWSESQRKKLEWTLPFMKLALSEWRKKAMRVAEQLVYSCSDFLPDQ